MDSFQQRIDFEREKEAFEREKEEEKHWSSNFDLWCKKSRHPQNVHSIVATFLKKISNETVYAIYSISHKDFDRYNWDGRTPHQYSELQLYIATKSKIYMMKLDGDINGNYCPRPPHTGVFKEIVKFSSEPSPTFWRTVFSQMGMGDTEFTLHGDKLLYNRSCTQLEAMFRSFRS